MEAFKYFFFRFLSLLAFIFNKPVHDYSVELFFFPFFWDSLRTRKGLLSISIVVPLPLLINRSEIYYDMNLADLGDPLSDRTVYFFGAEWENGAL